MQNPDTTINPPRHTLSRFDLVAAHYGRGRPCYPSELIRRVAAAVDLTEGDSVLDLGTGTGALAVEFARLGCNVLGVDPSEKMLEIAQTSAATAHVAVRFKRGSDADVAQLGEKPKLVTMGRAFHWMNREQLLLDIGGITPSDGAVALFGDTWPQIPENSWHRDFKALIEKYSEGDTDRPERRRLVASESVLLNSSFNQLSRLSIFEQRVTDLDSLKARALSFASTWHGTPGTRELDLAIEVRETLEGHADTYGRLNEVIEWWALIAQKSPPTT